MRDANLCPFEGWRKTDRSEGLRTSYSRAFTKNFQPSSSEGGFSFGRCATGANLWRDMKSRAHIDTEIGGHPRQRVTVVRRPARIRSLPPF